MTGKKFSKDSVELLIESLDSMIEIAKTQVEINEIIMKHLKAQDDMLDTIWAAVDRLEMK